MGEVGLARDGEELGAVNAVVNEGIEERSKVLALMEKEGQEMVGLPADALLRPVLEVVIQLIDLLAFRGVELRAVDDVQSSLDAGSTARPAILLSIDLVETDDLVQ